jgi:hypothetical protein
MKADEVKLHGVPSAETREMSQCGAVPELLGLRQTRKASETNPPTVQEKKR